MARMTDYIVLQDQPFRLPGEPLPVNDRHFPNIGAPNVHSGSPAILAFRVNPNDGDVTVQFRLNASVIVRQTFDTEPQRSWHEVIPPGVLKPTDNELTVAIDSNSQGSVQVSDIVIFFKTEVP